jgi:hypothetical protein
MKDKITEEDINDHLETYSPLFDKINNDEPYKPSLIFSWQEKIGKFVSKYVQTDCLDGEEELKELMKTVFWGIGLFVVITIGLVVVNGG